MPKKLTEKQKQVLREIVEFICQECHKHEKIVGKLEIHRIRRGYAGGEYIPLNIKLICKNCHKKYHYGENNKK